MSVSMIDGHIDRPQIEKITPQEAIELLNNVEFADKYQGKDEYGTMLLMSKDALEKQIPKKPNYEDIGNVYGALKRTCGNCGDICMVNKDAKPYEHYCRYCGNRFDDWGDIE